jgi:hypothetical protein
MHTEHLQNVKAGRVVGGWLVSVAITSLVLVVLAAMGVLVAERMDTGLVPSIIAVVIGFFVGGVFVGFRALAAPVLHAIGIGLMSLVVWFGVNTLMYGLLPALQWEALSMVLTVAVLFAQIVAATVGALIGYNLGVRGQISLSEEAPES